MGNHRGEPGPLARPSAGQTPQLGKRARRDVAPEESTTPSTYVGKRIARPTPTETEPAFRGSAPATTADATTTLVPTPRPDDTPSIVSSVELGSTLESVRRNETPGETTSEFDAIVSGSAVRSIAETDFTAEQTATLPSVHEERVETSGRRRAARAARTKLRGTPSVPVAVGLATLAVAAIGAVTTAAAPQDEAGRTPLHAASALGGTSAAGAAAEGVSDRSPAVSRNQDRAEAPTAASGASADAQADSREQALAALAAKATGQAQKLALNQWELPVEAGVYHLTGRFGQGGSYWSSTHTGLDFAAPTGTPIHAVAGGVVTETGYDGAYGNKTVITLDDGTEMWYCHQSEFDVSVGDEVAAGDVIGAIGSTGNSTGPHVHVEVRPGGGDPVDPYAAMVHEGLQP